MLQFYFNRLVQCEVIFQQAGTTFGMLPTVESAHEVSTSFENASVNLYIFFREKKDFNVPP